MYIPLRTGVPMTFSIRGTLWPNARFSGVAQRHALSHACHRLSFGLSDLKRHVVSNEDGEHLSANHQQRAMPCDNASAQGSIR